MIVTRRRFLASLATGMIVAPSLVRAESLMHVRDIFAPNPNELLFFKQALESDLGGEKRIATMLMNSRWRNGRDAVNYRIPGYASDWQKTERQHARTEEAFLPVEPLPSIYPGVFPPVAWAPRIVTTSQSFTMTRREAEKIWPRVKELRSPEEPLRYRYKGPVLSKEEWEERFGDAKWDAPPKTKGWQTFAGLTE